MIGELMLYGMVTAALLTAAGSAFERFAAGACWPRRWLWGLCLVLSVLIPVVRAFAPPPSSMPSLQLMTDADLLFAQLQAPVPALRISATQRDLPSTVAGKAPDTVVPAPRSAARGGHSLLQWLEFALLPAWIAASTLLLLLYTALWLRLRSTARYWKAADIDGQRVWITESLGPAVLGCIAPRILLPPWFLEAPANARALIVAHERAHIEGRDPWLLQLGLLAVLLAPWNLPLWWQLRRLRFAIEVDCDARVLARLHQPREYAETLLLVAQRRGRTTASLPAVALSEPASQLLRRVRILSAPFKRRSRMFLAGAAALGSACIAGAAVVQAPAGLAQHSLRKPPSSETLPPHYALAEAAARRRFPELFKGHFDGQVEIAVGLDRQGRLLGIERRRYSLPLMSLSPGFTTSWAQRHGYDIQDLMEHFERLEAWHGPLNADKLYLNYDVIKWPHDPARSAQRVRTALLARYPQLMQPVANGKGVHDGGLITVVMKDDGTLDQVRFSKDRLGLDARFRAMGFDPRQLVHRGVIRDLWWDDIRDPRRLRAAHYTVVYAWPRRPQDDLAAEPLAAECAGGFDIFPLGPCPSGLGPDERTDRALVQRYFPNYWQHGPALSDESLWVLLDWSGRVFAAGIDNAFEDQPDIEAALFPGATIGAVGWGGGYGYAYAIKPEVGRAAIVGFSWLGPDSGVTKVSQIDPGQRKDLLVMAQLRRDGKPVAGFPVTLDFGVPAVHDVTSGVRLSIEASAAHGGAVDMRLRLLTTPDRLAGAVDAGPYASAVALLAESAVALPANSPRPIDCPPNVARVDCTVAAPQTLVQLSDAEGQIWQINLRIHRLADLLIWPVSR